MIESNPQATFPLVLSQHKGLPESQQPRLHFRVLRRCDTKTVLALAKRIKEIQTHPDAAEEGIALFDEIEGFLRSRLAGWDGQRDERDDLIPFDPARFDEVVDEADMVELLFRLHQESTLTAGDRKKSASQSPSSSASSASTAMAVGV